MTSLDAGRTALPVRGLRLLDAWYETGAPADLAAHLDRHGPLPVVDAASLIAEVEAAGLRGRGGAGFPTARKLRAVATGARKRPVVIANGCESEPAGAKDTVLLELAPHLVVDGTVLAAQAVGAIDAVLCLHAGSPARAAVEHALAERTDPIAVRVVEVPRRFVAGQASALAHHLDGGPAVPTTTPPHLSERGVGGRPTLVDNVETLARLALVARYGAQRFRVDGTEATPGALLLTLGGALLRPGVQEVPAGIPLGAALDLAGGPATRVSALLVGGYGGTWVPVPEALDLRLSHEDCAAAGVALGSGILLALPSAACGLRQTLHLLRYLAGESARQCGPCRFGLPAIAADLREIVAASRGGRAAHERLTRRLAVLPGRGACAHPDGAARLAASALRVFAGDVDAHLRGQPCPGAGGPSMFPSDGTR